LINVLKSQGIFPSLLTFIDEIDLDKVQKVVLVDHNRLAPSQDSLRLFVTEIIDHHHDETIFLQERIPIKKNIEVVGSVCTLIAEILLKNNVIFDEHIARLLLSAILIDTTNLNKSLLKTTDKDIFIAQQLSESIPVAIPTSDLFLAIFTFVEELKFDISGLTANQLLKKDYKEYRVENSLGGTSIGFSSVTLPFDEWLTSGADLCLEYSRFLQQKSLDILIITTPTKIPHSKQMILFSADSELYTRGVELLATFRLPPQTIYDVQLGCNFLSVNLVDLSYSRKKLAPLLTEFFQSL